MTLCPCQSGLDYHTCCQPLHLGQPASSPEALMRSRFSAFARHDSDYISRSWHPSQRPASLTLDNGEHWIALTVIASGADGDSGWVHFQATSQDAGGLSVLEEKSRFVRENGHWYYLDGQPTVTALKPGRNDPCPCGSAKKFKKCHG